MVSTSLFLLCRHAATVPGVTLDAAKTELRELLRTHSGDTKHDDVRAAVKNLQKQGSLKEPAFATDLLAADSVAIGFK